MYERARQISQQHYGERSLDYALRLGRLAMVYKDKAKHFGDSKAMEKSVSLHEEAIDILERLTAGDRAPAHELESYLHNFGLTLIHDGQGEKALQVLKRGLTLAKTKYPEESPDVAIFHENIGCAFAAAAAGAVKIAGATDHFYIEAAGNFVEAARIYQANGMVQRHRINSFGAMYCYRHLGFDGFVQLYDVGFNKVELIERSINFESMVFGYKSEASHATRDTEQGRKERYFAELRKRGSYL